MSETSSPLVTEGDGDFGRIEVVPEILLSIAERSTRKTEGVVSLAEIPNSELRRNNRRLRSKGILLTLEKDSVTFDIYVIMDASVNLMDTSRRLQATVVEGVDKMVGISARAVNIHVEDVAYSS